MESKFRCACFFRENFYSKILKSHFSFKNEKSFLKTYENYLINEKNVGTDIINTVVKEFLEELHRREELGLQIRKRKTIIRDQYIPKHLSVYAFDENFLSQEFLNLVKSCRNNDAYSVNQIVKKECESVFSFPVFTADFCRMLLEELENFNQSSVPKGRPNSMNQNGILFDELLDFNKSFVNPFRECYIQPITSWLYAEFNNVCLDSHKAFTVEYEMGKDLELGYHYDNAEITLNICIGKDFDDGQLYFGDMKESGTDIRNEEKQIKFSEVNHTSGRGVLHKGLHRHGALPISFGERCNFIVWCRASSIRNKICPMCGNKPELVAVEGGHDGFTLS